MVHNKQALFSGNAVGLCGLVTTQDNLRVENATFFVRGRFENPTHRINASAVWEAAGENLVMEFNLPSGDDFTFSQGGLYSDYLPSSKVAFVCKKLHLGKDADTLSHDEYGKAGIEDFALRMVCQLSRATTVKKGVTLR